MKILLFCGMLAAGEFAASLLPGAADAWPAVTIALVLIALFGYGLTVRGWSHVVVFLLGAALYLQASTGENEKFRERPWMRGRAYPRGRTADMPPGALKALRRDFSRRLVIGLAPATETAPLSRAILLGERSRLSAPLKRLFVESGTMHVFAISGLHVSAIAEILAAGLAVFFVPRRFLHCAAAPILWSYVWMIGFPASAVRAALMATFSALAPLFWRRPDGIRSWALTFLAVHVVNPLQISDVGSALSFSVMLAIALTGSVCRNWPKWKQSLLMTFAAWAAGAPIAAHVFGRVTPGGLVANLILLATARLAVMTGVAGVATSFVSATIAGHLNNLSALAVRAMVLIAEAVTRIPGSNLETGFWPLSACAAWYAACAVGCVWSCRRLRQRNLP